MLYLIFQITEYCHDTETNAPAVLHSYREKNRGKDRKRKRERETVRMDGDLVKTKKFSDYIVVYDRAGRLELDQYSVSETSSLLVQRCNIYCIVNDAVRYHFHRR